MTQQRLLPFFLAAATSLVFAPGEAAIPSLNLAPERGQAFKEDLLANNALRFPLKSLESGDFGNLRNVNLFGVESLPWKNIENLPEKIKENLPYPKLMDLDKLSLNNLNNIDASELEMLSGVDAWEKVQGLPDKIRENLPTSGVKPFENLQTGQPEATKKILEVINPNALGERLFDVSSGLKAVEGVDQLNVGLSQVSRIKQLKEKMPNIEALKGLKGLEGRLPDVSVGITKSMPAVPQKPLAPTHYSWGSYLPKDIDWRNYLHEDFQWMHFLPAAFSWKQHLSPFFPILPADALHWESFVRHAFDWEHLQKDMAPYWSDPVKKRMIGLFPAGKLPWSGASLKGANWAVLLHEFFNFQRLLHAGFDWRQYLKPNVDLRQYVKPGYDARKFVSDDFNWRAHLPTSVDWRHYLSNDFDWLNFLKLDPAHYFPKNMDWNAVIPAKLPSDFHWQPFFLSMIHWKKFLPVQFTWNYVIPTSLDWLYKFHQLDWEKVFQYFGWHEIDDYVMSIPSHFQWEIYAEQVATRFHELVGKFVEAPHEFYEFLARLHGVVQWGQSKKETTKFKNGPTYAQNKRILALLGALNLHPTQYVGNVDQLEKAYLSRLASSWFH